MEPSTRALGYDLVKLMVAISLLILFLFLMLRAAPQSLAPESVTPTLASLPSTATLSSKPTIVPASPTSFPLTVTAVQESSPTEINTPLPTTLPTLRPTPIPSHNEAPMIESTATPIAEIPSAIEVCKAAASQSRLQVGMKATILRHLNFRSSPGIRDNWLLTNIPSTKVEVVGGPVCLPHFIGAYQWWQIKLPNGQIGWSAEASLRGAFYFMEPSP